MSLLAPVTADIAYAPPSVQARSGKPVYLHLVDERRSEALSRGEGFSVYVLNQVNMAVSMPGEKTAEKVEERFTTPAKAALLAMSSRLRSMGREVVTDDHKALGNVQRLALYVYSFEVSFAGQTYSNATVALALGKIPQDVYKINKPVTPASSSEYADSIYAPFCTQSVGLGAAPIVAGKEKDSAGVSLSQALERAVNALDVRGCLR